MIPAHFVGSLYKINRKDIKLATIMQYAPYFDYLFANNNSCFKGHMTQKLTVLFFSLICHPVNFACGRIPEHPEKTHDFRQSVD
jgi:hypothetical protein